MQHLNDEAPALAQTKDRGSKGVSIGMRDNPSHSRQREKAQATVLAANFDHADENERERLLAELRVQTLKARLFIAEVEAIGVLVKQKLMSPGTARDWLEDGIGGAIIEGEAREVATA
jgi:hypothetical protein